jgi:hypothetical protein
MAILFILLIQMSSAKKNLSGFRSETVLFRRVRLDPGVTPFGTLIFAIAQVRNMMKIGWFANRKLANSHLKVSDGN